MIIVMKIINLLMTLFIKKNTEYQLNYKNKYQIV